MKFHKHCEINGCQCYALGGDECGIECDMLVGDWDMEPEDKYGRNIDQILDDPRHGQAAGINSMRYKPGEVQ